MKMWAKRLNRIIEDLFLTASQRKNWERQPFSTPPSPRNARLSCVLLKMQSNSHKCSKFYATIIFKWCFSKSNSYGGSDSNRSRVVCVLFGLSGCLAWVHFLIIIKVMKRPAICYWSNFKTFWYFANWDGMGMGMGLGHLQSHKRVSHTGTVQNHPIHGKIMWVILWIPILN